GDSLRLWFDRAVTAQFDCHTAYTQYIWALRPRWSGSHAEMIAFGKACANTKRYDTNVPMIFIRALEDIGTELPNIYALFQEPVFANEVIAVEKGLLNAPERQVERQKRLSYLIFHAWACKRYDEAKAALAELKDGKIYPTVLQFMKERTVNETAMRAQISLGSGP